MPTQLRNAVLQRSAHQFIPLSRNLTAVAFPLMKLYPAEHCVSRAIADGLVTPDTLIIESSSGTMGYGLAVVCALAHLRLAIVSDPAADPRLCRRLRLLGVRVEIVERPADAGGFQRARLDRLREVAEANQPYWWVNQYDNPANGEAYESIALEIAERTGGLDYLVGTVGSGGSLCGAAKSLRKHFPKLTVVAVDTFGSVLFGQADAPRTLRGLGNSLLPGNLKHELVDWVHWVSAPEAFAATVALYRSTTLFQGPTSGACWMVAEFHARTNPDAHVLCFLPDAGDRYVDTVYDEDHLKRSKLFLGSLPACPVEVMHPDDAREAWSCMRWARRRIDEVVATPALKATLS